MRNSEDAHPTAVERPPRESEPGVERAVADTEPVADSGRPSLGVLPDRYEAGDEIGRGGMGRVIEARDKMLGRTVAVKEALDTDSEALRRFARETQITARLEHPSIVPVYDAGFSPEGAPFYVMRKVTGRPLDNLVAAADRLEDRLALLPHVMAASQAIAHAHERGIIHRDLKPTNILVGARGETIVIDWGLAKALDETDVRAPTELSAGDSLKTRVGTVFGTPGFMSPEQLASSNVDERADVYALGATLFYVLARKAPHGGKSADDVEEAARTSPPPPIASVVPGVPRELSTIVDKALAYDLAVRYPHAGALASELSRFMTGQLVAAHAYTRREKIARFVRRHRALVIALGAALAICAVGAFIAVGRVLSARDEAIAQARAAEAAQSRESDRASDLVVSQARLLLTTNPTAAVAMIRPLARTARWREVRAIAAGARAHGVAWKLPGPTGISFADMSHDGMRAVVGSSDGSVHAYDLAARTHTVVGTLTGRVRATFVDDTRIVAWTGATLTTIDITTRATQSYTRPDPVARAEGSGGFLYFVDEQRRAWRMDAATGETIAIPVTGAAHKVAVSPDGKRVVFSGDHLWMIETKRPDLVETIHAGKKFDLAWSTNSEHVLAIGETAIYDITIHPEIEVDEYDLTNQAAVLARGTVYSAGLSGWTAGRRKLGASDLGSAILGLYVTKGDFVVGAEARDKIRVFDGEHFHTIAVPITPLSALRASPRSPYIFAVAADSVLVWNIEHVMPKRIPVPAYSQIVTFGKNTAWAIANSGNTVAIDMRTGETRHISQKLATMRYAAPRSGSHVIARPLASRDTLLIRPDGTSESIPVDASIALVLDESRALIATKQHEVVVYDVVKRTQQKLGTFTSKIDRIIAYESAPRWIVAALDDGTVWRYDLTTATSTQTKIAPRTEVFSPGFATSAPANNGDVFIADGPKLKRWRLDGTIVDHVTLPRRVDTIQRVDDTRMIASTDDATGYLVHIDRPELTRMAALGFSYSWGNDQSLIVTDERSHGVTVVDLEVNAAWKIARATPQAMTPNISGDGTAVIMRDASGDSTAVALWNLALPASPEATHAWIEELTNATFDPRTGILGWAP